ncbi:MAG: hypothetical protein V4628_08955, partial [Pseudomonadota bacterium]
DKVCFWICGVQVLSLVSPFYLRFGFVFVAERVYVPIVKEQGVFASSNIDGKTISIPLLSTFNSGANFSYWSLTAYLSVAFLADTLLRQFWRLIKQLRNTGDTASGISANNSHAVDRVPLGRPPNSCLALNTMSDQITAAA